MVRPPSKAGTRQRIWRRSAQGVPVARTAEMTSTSAERARKVIHNFSTGGSASLHPKRKGGRPKIFRLPERREIKQIAKFKSAHCSPRGGRRHQPRGPHILLREEGVAFQRVKTWKTSKDPDHAAKKARGEHLCAIVGGEVAP
jgi:transposase